MKTITRRLLPFAAASLAVPAFAQAELAATNDDQRVTASENSAESGDAERKRRRMEEVIVTATRRAVDVQDVPISITAITAYDIDRRGLIGAEDYLRGIPGVNQMAAGFNGQAIVIRGIETQTTDQNFFSGATVSTYFGETPTTTAGGTLSSNADIKLVDIERVEVLRGPQGTAFGNSSMGGAVRTIPVPPQFNELGGKLHAGYSSTSGFGDQNYDLHAVGNIPLIDDRLAVRAVAYAFSDSGFYRNLAGSDAAFRTDVVTPFGAESFASDEEEVGAYYSSGARVAALFHASDDLRFTLSYLTQKSEVDGFALQTQGAYEQTVLRVAPEHVYRGQAGGLSDTQIDIANVVMEYDLSWADLIGTYSHVEGKVVQVLPGTTFGFMFPVSFDYSPGNHREDVGEIRLASKLNGPWNFLVGLYAERHEDDYNIDILWHGDPALSFAPGERSLGEYLDRRDLRQKAAFGEVSWEFLPGLTLTGGARTYKFERTLRADRSGLFYGGPLNTNRQQGEASDTNFRADLSYKPTDGAHVYAGWTQGFRLGKPQSGVITGICDTNGDGFIDGSSVTVESTRFLDSDSVDSYELGGKFSFLDRRVLLDAALFRMDWSDIPVSVTAGTQACGYIANAGEARSEGIELQGMINLTDAIRVSMGGSYIDAQLTEDVPAQTLFAGDRLPGSPRVTANLGAEYGFDIATRAASVRVDAIHVGSFSDTIGSSAVHEAGDYVKLDASARISLGSVSIDLYARNLTNEDAFTFRGGQYNVGRDFGYRLRPRTIGVQLDYSFGR